LLQLKAVVVLHLGRRYEWLSLQYHTKFPSEVISAHGAKLQMGHCWPMRSDRGNLTVRLCAPIHPSAATLEHLSLLVGPSV
jgi:hypothetical protein